MQRTNKDTIKKLTGSQSVLLSRQETVTPVIPKTYYNLLKKAYDWLDCGNSGSCCISFLEPTILDNCYTQKFLLLQPCIGLLADICHCTAVYDCCSLYTSIPPVSVMASTFHVLEDAMKPLEIVWSSSPTAALADILRI